MFFNSLAFLSGIMLLQNFTVLPTFYWGWGIFLGASILMIFSGRIFKYIKLFALFAFGFAWCVIYANGRLAWVLPSDLEGKTVIVVGHVATIPEMHEQRTTFLFSLENIQGDSAENIQSDSEKMPAHGLVHLSWQNPQKKLHVGDEWQFSVRLKKIYSTQNPGGFDYEAWSFQEGISAKGYIYDNHIKLNSHAKDYRDDNQIKLINSHWYVYPLMRIRECLYGKILQILPVSNTSPWIIALALGIREGIRPENWEVLQNTGTNHLMAIAGLHIGLLSSFIYVLFKKVWRQFPLLVLKWPAQHAGGVAALITAMIYSALAGFTLPTQRACLMLIIFFLISLLRRYRAGVQVWGLTLLIVLLINPLSVLTESFWLSFSSVALIMYGVGGRLAAKGLWWKWGRIQWVLTLGLMPLTVWFFQKCSFISVIANVIAIPWVGFLIVPLTLFGCVILLFSMKLGGIVLSFSDQLLALLWKVLWYLSHLSWATWYHPMPNIYFLISACLGVIILLLPMGFPGRWLGGICLLPFILYKPLAPALGEVWFTLLDVGQGLSAIIQTHQHILVYDTGAHLGDEYDMGQSVVLPFLRTIGAQKIDMMVISHGDNDHSGGAQSIMTQIPVLMIKTSRPDLFYQSVNSNRPDLLYQPVNSNRQNLFYQLINTSHLNLFSPENSSHSNLFYQSVSYCLQHEHWQWDDVYFSFIYPSTEQLGLNNDSSCVLKVVTKSHSILLPGDIEKNAEKYLVKEISEGHIEMAFHAKDNSDIELTSQEHLGNELNRDNPIEVESNVEEYLAPRQMGKSLEAEMSAEKHLTTGQNTEKCLTKEFKNELSAEILIAPHHGSKTSAVDTFIQAVHPKIVLFPVGYRNRYHFPHQAVLAKYKELGVKQYNSVTAGAIQFKLTDRSDIVPILYRPLHQYYWNAVSY